MAIAVTGGCGFLGLNCAELLLERGAEVLLFDRRPDLPADARQTFDALPGNYTYVSGDINDADALRQLCQDFSISSMLHAAVITPGAQREHDDALHIVNVNLMGTLQVLQIARDYNIRLLYPSSASVYGDNAYDDPLLEEASTIPIPNTMYAIAKYAAERSCLRAAQLWDMDVRVARVGAAFGAWEHASGVRDTLSAPMLTTALALRGEEVRLPRPGPRDWVYSRDVATALIALLEAPQPRYALYNISAGVRWNVADWCEKLRMHFPDFRYRVVDDPAEANVHTGARDRSPLATERLQEDIYKPVFDLEAAFTDYMQWVEQHSDFWLP